MPLSPDFSEHRPDPRFDRYRGRFGRLFRGDQEVGLVLVEVETVSAQAGGHLWWRRWGSTQDVLQVWTVVDGRPSDSSVGHEHSEGELQDYDAPDGLAPVQPRGRCVLSAPARAASR